MNIFPLHADPILAANDNCDQHLLKIPLEISQLVSNCFTIKHLEEAPKTQNNQYRKHCHYNHPKAKWIRESRQNFDWAITHYYALLAEKNRRRDENKSHYTESFVEWAVSNIDSFDFKNNKFTEHPQCFSEFDYCRIDGDPIRAYRLYYVIGKPFVTWMNREVPKWYVEMKNIANLV